MPEDNTLHNTNEPTVGSLSEAVTPNVLDTAESQTRRLKTLRTFQGDIDEAITSNKTSKVNIVVAEQKRNIEQNIPQKQSDTRVDGAKNKLFVYLGLMMLVLAIIIIAGVYLHSIQKTNTLETITESDTLIRYTSTVSLDISQSNASILSDSILTEKKKFTLPVNAVLYLDVQKNKTHASVSDFLETLTPQIPSELLRNLNEKYMLGVYSFDTNEPFILLTTSDYGLAYSGMLAWEQTLANDLGQVFSLSASTTQTHTFTDEALRNKDMRIVRNENGKTVLLYSFIDKNTILITSNEKIFNAILAKYITGEMVR